MNNEIKQFKVQANDPYFTASKWNETLDYSINFEKILNNILGPKFKGIYKVSNKYDKYDYVWYDDSIYQISGTNDFTPEVSNSYGLSNIFKYKNGLLGLNQRKEIVYYTNIESIIINNSFDSFYFDYLSKKCYGVKDNRIYSINLENKEVKLLNIIFGDNVKIEKILCDEVNIYIKTSDTIYKSVFSNPESTLFEEIYKGKNIVDFDISHNLLFVVDLYNGMNIIGKIKNDKTAMKISIGTQITSDIRVAALNNNTFAIYDGKSSILTFFNNGTGIFNLESTIINYEGFNKGISYISRDEKDIVITSLNNTIVKIPAVKYKIEKVDFKHVISRNTNIELDSSIIACHLPYKNGYYTFNSKTYINDEESNFKIVDFLPTVKKLEKIYFDFSTISYFKVVMLKLKTNANGKSIAKAYYNNFVYDIILPEFKEDEVTVFLEYSKDNKMIATFVTKDKIIEKEIESKPSSKTNILVVSSEYTVMVNEVAIFLTNLTNSYKDYLANNIIIPTKDIINKPIPYSNTHLDSDGNLPIKIKNNSILKEKDGISVNISDDFNSNNREIAFSTAGANSLYSQLNENIKKILSDFSDKTHTHRFDELKDIPIASQSIKGITTIAQSVSDSTITAISPKAVKDFVKSELTKYKHPHPYLNVETGGIVKGNINCKDFFSDNIYAKKLEADNATIKYNLSVVSMDSDTLKTKNINASDIASNSVNTSFLTLNGCVISIVK